MKQIKTFSDSRLDTQCAYCGEFPDTRDHVPSKILLEKPFPRNLPVVPSCLKCNNRFSLDEEYFACLIECLISGTTDLEGLSRKRIVKILKRKSKLKRRLDDSFFIENEKLFFKIEKDRVENVILKLAYGHAKFENSVRQYENPKYIKFLPIELMTDEEQNSFYEITELQKLTEVGSRGMQNIYFTETGIPVDNWILVQKGVYQYSVTPGINKLRVRMIIWNYLACEVVW